MRTVGNAIYVEIEKELQDEIKTESGLELKLAADYELYQNTTQHGKVFACNEGLTSRYGFKKGDTVYFHHFVPVAQTMHSYYESQGEEVEGHKVYKAFAPEQVYAYTPQGTEEVIMISHWVFVEPIVIEAEKTASGIILDPFTEKEVLEEGIIRFANQELIDLGAPPGTRVRFSTDSEYEMTILNQRLWRMRNQDILAVIG